MVAEPDIKWVGCNVNGYSKGRGGVLFEAICLHTTAGGATIGALDNWFNNPAAGVSAHFGVGPGGEIHQYVALDDEAFAHGIVDHSLGTRLVVENAGVSPNRWAIGIEHVDGGVAGTVTAKQLAASQRLAAWLFQTVILPNAAKTGAVVDRDHVLGHSQIGSHPQCPSWPALRFSDYVARVRALLGAPAPAPVDHTRELIDALSVYRDLFHQQATEAAVRAANIDALLQKVSR